MTARPTIVTTRFTSTAGSHDLPVLDDVRPGRTALHTEAAALTLLALVVMTGSASGSAADQRGGDDGRAVLLVGLAVLARR